MATIYKCPSCGGNMLFDAHTGMLKCEQCSNEMPVEAYRDADAKEEDNAYVEEGRKQYRCPSCGATLLTGAYTAATTCAYCGSPNIIEEQVDEQFQPDVVLPFRIARKEAEHKLRTWCKGGLLTPSDFLRQDALTVKLQGIYVPFWVYDIATDAQIMAACERHKVTRMGNKETTRCYKYNVKRAGKSTFAKIPRDASKRMDNTKMDLLEPFQWEQAKTFDAAYLSGYSAERYSETQEEVYGRAEQIAEQYAVEELRNTIVGYDKVLITRQHVEKKCTNVGYAMYPVWHYEYTYHDKLYEFMMNGQTGKVVGKPPISIAKLLFVAVSTFAASFSLLASIAQLL